MFNRDDLLISSAQIKFRPRAEVSWPQRAIYWPELSSHGSAVRDIALEVFHDAEADGMLKENNNHTFEGYDPATLFREFAVECIELAQTSSSPEKHKLYLKMASVWHQMAQRWENKQWPSPWYGSDRARDRVRPRP